MANRGKLFFVLILLLGVPLAHAVTVPKYSKKEINQWRKTYTRPTEIPYPATNPYSKEKELLGRTLFSDPRLSGPNTVACITCHDPQKAWSDDRALGVGHAGKVLARRVPSIVNAAWGKSFFWDGRALTLEEQAAGPIQNPDEMNEKFENLIKELSAVPGYRELFDKAFPGKPISQKTITDAIATFERSLRTSIAPFDRWVKGDEKAISEKAKRGFVLFNTVGKCSVCHDRWNFSDGSFADTGVDSDDPGMGSIDSSPFVQHFFKTPSLRNVSLRKAFMHNGSLPTLEAVVAFYNQGGVRKRKTVSPDIRPLELSLEQSGELVEFLRTLTSPDPIPAAPVIPK